MKLTPSRPRKANPKLEATGRLTQTLFSAKDFQAAATVVESSVLWFLIVANFVGWMGDNGTQNEGGFIVASPWDPAS